MSDWPGNVAKQNLLFDLILGGEQKGGDLMCFLQVKIPHFCKIFFPGTGRQHFFGQFSKPLILKSAVATV